MQKIDITGNKYGRLIVIKEDGKKGKNVLWLCKCECGNYIHVIAYNLKNGHTKSCGCLAQEVKSKVHLSHNCSKTPLFRTWQHMLNRCRNKKINEYKNYGGRGISVCKEWQTSFESFRDWAISNGYSENLSIDRINVNGNYEPSNCRWTNAKIQANNKRNNRLLTYNNKTQTLSQWADEINISSQTIKKRIDKYGWSIKDALTKPLRRTIPYEPIQCACGCGTIINRYSKDGRERKYVQGHNNYRQGLRQGDLGKESVGVCV